MRRNSPVRLRAGAQQDWAAHAPAMIVCLADVEESPNWCLNDLGIAVEHMVLAAWTLGLGTCWMGQSNREDLLKDLLGIPDKYRPVVLIKLGEADESPVAKQRKSLESIVSWEKYS